jgi:hypothetical protein
MHEHQVSTSASALAVASVAHPEEILLSSPIAIVQANLRRSEQNASVSYGYKYVLAVTDD